MKTIKEIREAHSNLSFHEVCQVVHGLKEIREAYSNLSFPEVCQVIHGLQKEVEGLRTANTNGCEVLKGYKETCEALEDEVEELRDRTSISQQEPPVI